MQSLLGRSRAQAEKPEQQIPQTIQADNGRPEKDSEQGKRTHHGERGAFAALEGEAFRSKLAKHNVQRGYDDEGDGDGNGVRADLREAPQTVGKKRLNEVGEGRFADPAEGERRDGDAELGGCEASRWSMVLLSARARRCPSATSCVTRLRRTATKENSAATKKPFAATSRRIARSPAMSIQMLLAVGMVTSHRPGAVSAAFALPPD